MSRWEENHKGLTLILATVRGQWKGAIRDVGQQLHTCDGPDAETVLAQLRKQVDQSEELSFRYPTDTCDYKGLEFVFAAVGDRWIGKVRDRRQYLDRREGGNRDEVLLQLIRAVNDSDTLLLRHPLDIRTYNGFSIRTIEKEAGYQSFVSYRGTEILHGELSSSLEDAVSNVVAKVNDSDTLLLRHPLDIRTYNGFSIRTIEKEAGYQSFVSYRGTEILHGELSSSLEDAVSNVVAKVDTNPNILEAHLTANHRRMLLDFEVPYLDQIGVKRLKEGRQPRYANCWACHHPIDNLNFHECEGCGWIICFCGACGCSYANR